MRKRSNSRRREELAVRIALGANARQVVAMVLGETSLLVIAGLAAGLALAMALTRMLTSQLYGLTPFDPASYAGAVVLLAAVAFLAAWLPARKASLVDPMAALRQQ